MLKSFRVLVFGCILFIIPGLGTFSVNAAYIRAEFIQDTIKITDFGVKPNSRTNVVSAVQAALKACKDKTNPVLSFLKGRYDFWPQHATEKEYYESNSTNNNPKTLGVLIEKFTNLTIDGNGKERSKSIAAVLPALWTILLIFMAFM